MPSFFGPRQFKSDAEMDTWVKAQVAAGKTGMWFWILLAGVGAMVILGAGGIAGYLFKKSNSGSDVPDPESDKLSNARTMARRKDLLKTRPVAFEVLAHLLAFLANDEERSKVIEAVRKAETKKGFEFPRVFWDSPDQALAWLGSKDLGVSIDDKAFHAAWNRGLPAAKRKEKKKNRDEIMTEALTANTEAVRSLGEKVEGLQPAGA